MQFDIFSKKDRAPAELQIFVNEKELVELYPFLLEATADCSRTEAAVASLTFSTRRNEFGSWIVQDEEALKPWAKIVLSVAFGSRIEEIMRGYIREVRLEAPEDAGNAQVKVECQDDSFRLDRTQRCKTWGTTENPSSDTLLLAQILSVYGMKIDKASGSGQERLVGVEQDDTDIKFLRSRAEFNGYELIFREGKVYFGPMRLQDELQSPIMVYAGSETNCLSLSVRADGHQPDAVLCDAPSERGDTVESSSSLHSNLYWLGKSPANSSNAGLEDFSWKLSAEAGADANRLRMLAQTKINDIDIHRIQGDGELDGSLYGHVLKAGLPVAVDGIGERMSGIYYVDSVSHSFTPQGYRQRFRILRNGYGDNLDTVPKLAPALSGVR